jgi:hypothetical protein
MGFCMTVEETLQNALDFLERQDLRAMLLKRFPQILRTVHSYEKFNKDLKVFQLADPVLIDSKVHVAPADVPLIRDLLDIKTYTGYHSSIIHGVPVNVGDNQVVQVYRDLSQGNAQADYFGYKYEQGFYKLGDTITIVGVSSDIKLIDMLASVWPTWEYDPFTEVYTSNSWILAEYARLVELHLIAAGAANQQMTTMLNTTRQELADTANDFLNEYAGEIYGRQRT